MDSPPKLAGETLIVHHIPLVHCQVPDRPCCGTTSKRANPFGQADSGALRTGSLPERDLSQADSLLYSTLLQAPEATLAPGETPEEKEAQRRDLPAPGANKRQNPFLLGGSETQDLCEDELGKASFHLHELALPPFRLHELALPPFRLHDTSPVVKPWSGSPRADVVEGQEEEEELSREDARKRSRLAPELMELDEYGCHRAEPSSFSFEQEWASDGEELAHSRDAPRSRTCSCSSAELQRCCCYSLSSQSEAPDQPMGYVSDSSCNSSDGVLVNFSALYNKMNGHTHPNLNSGAHSCDDSSSGSHSDSGAFYLDLHSSPSEPKAPGEPHQACGCHHASSPVLDANCNSYPALCEPCASEASDLTACFQSQARLVVATQNYYKLVTCDLSSQSSPSPAGSSITSCSEEHPRGSPLQPTEYYLFQRPDAADSDTDCSRAESQGEAEKGAIEGQVYINVSPPTLAGPRRQRSRSYDRSLDRSPTGRLGSLERMMSCPVKLSDGPALPSQGSPPKRVTSFAELAKGRKKTGSSPPLRTSRDSSLEFSPIPEYQRDGQAGHSQSLPSHALNRSCEGYCGAERGLSTPRKGMGSREMPSCGQEGPGQPFFSALMEPGSASGLGQKDIRARADGGAADSKSVVRYSKAQRPTTLPIQPFVFQHHFAKQPKAARALHSHFAASLSQLYSRSAASQTLSSASQSSASATSAEMVVQATAPGHGQRSADGAASRGDGCARKPVPETTRPSPLGSYSPVRSNVPFFQSADSSSSSSSSCSPGNENHPPRSRSCPVSANLLPTGTSPPSGSQAAKLSSNANGGALLAKKESPPPAPTKGPVLLPEVDAPAPECQLHRSTALPPLMPPGLILARPGDHGEPQWPLACSEALGAGSLGPRPLNANHLSPQALKWREYRRKNPLGLERISGLAGSLDWKQPEGRLPWKNPIFELPLSTGRASCRLNGHSLKQPQLNYSDFFPDYFSLAEKPPAEFCLSPDGNTESISIDLLQKKGLVKAINMAVDLIVAHFGTSRDPGVKAKLGNSSVSPNVGHLILKYLCPAIRDVLSDGLKGYVLDVIIGQRRNIPWSVVEASTQLGPSTKVLHGLCSKVSQYPELTSHSMRFNAFILGLLNIRSLEFWFNHLYNHEDIVQVHYQPVGFLSLSHSVCQGLFEELLLLLQPLSLLPFSLDLLFEHHLLQMGKEQQQQKEMLRVQQGLVLSAHSTLQLMRSRGPGAVMGAGATGSSSSSLERSVGSWGVTEQDRGRESHGGPPAKAAEERVKGVGAPSVRPEREAESGRWKEPPEPKKDKQASWWYQLMQSSQVYIEGSAEGARFARYERRKKGGAGVTPRPVEPKKGPPLREGVVEGAEACPIAEVPLPDRAPADVAAAGTEPRWKAETPSAREAAKEKTLRPFWMGSPPDSVLTELKQSSEKEAVPAPKQGGPQEDHGTPKWGHLFGSRKAPKEPKQANRLPSGWLSLDRSVLQLMAQTVGATVWREASSEPERLALDPPPAHPKQPLPDRRGSPETPCSEVKALCHHIATEAGQLSFKKGDVLRVVGKVDADWLRCRRGAESGLVPIMYVTHMEDEDY
ncbi:AP-4 complex accessory subunit RUSC2 isoform X2 [Zootoca vivipara]|uniref:AP-4 complex accessory subunit RUSC2 isoform X2 n=1 Tax=Zootoca vivipara TaxID=8524 RepID=UPI00293BF2F4|nr:AP-4 complex accessory subunit RUSC2 isoform X2 [Zootoca vivipara]